MQELVLKFRLVVSSYVLSTIIWLLLLLVLLEKQPNLKLHVPSILEIVKLLHTFFRFHLKQNHSYHMQAQGQLNVCKEVFLCCLFVLGHMCY